MLRVLGILKSVDDLEIVFRFEDAVCCASCGWIPKTEEKPVARLWNIFSSDYAVIAAKLFMFFSVLWSHSQDGQQLQVALLRDACILDKIMNLTVIKVILSIHIMHFNNCSNIFSYFSQFYGHILKTVSSYLCCAS